MRKKVVKRIETFEMWIWRRMEKISWTEHRTNEEVLKKVEEKRSLMDIIRTEQKNWIGHILRGNSLQREITERSMELFDIWTYREADYLKKRERREPQLNVHSS